MSYRKNIFIILFIVLALTLSLEMMRSDYLFKLSKNVNAYSDEEFLTKKSAISDSSLTTIEKERYLVIYDSQEASSVKLKNNTLKTLNYMKKDVDAVDLIHFTGSISSNYNGIILTFEQLKKLVSLDPLVDYVEHGGSVFFAERPSNDNTFYRVYRKLGIYEANEMSHTKGIKLLTNVLLNATGFSTDKIFIENSSLIVRLTKNCNIHAVTENDLPLLWDISYGKGKFMMFNGTMLSEKINRGLLAGAISMLSQDFIYPVMNMKIMFIDDFPAPIPQGYDKDIYREYAKSLPEFYRQIWWPDVRKSSFIYDVDYSAMLIETYNDWVMPSFKLENIPGKDELIIYGREVVKNGGELGIHGYNHQSLAEAGFIKQNLGYKPWKNEDNMIGALKEVNRFAKSIFPSYEFESYVPPSNIISPFGRKALLKGMPNLKTISSVYLEDINENAYVQEFEVSSDGVVELPRITSGYEYNQESLWDVYNGITTHGVFSHFIHPDDILDTKRNFGMSWPELYKQYNLLLRTLKDNYPWLRSMTVSHGSQELKRYLECKTYVERRDNLINVYTKDFSKEMFFVFRTDKKITSYTHCTGSKIDDGVYLIHTEKPVFSIGLSR